MLIGFRQTWPGKVFSSWSMDSTSPSSVELSLFSHRVRHCSDTEWTLQMDSCLLKLDFSRNKNVFGRAYLYFISASDYIIVWTDMDGYFLIHWNSGNADKHCYTGKINTFSAHCPAVHDHWVQAHIPACTGRDMGHTLDRLLVHFMALTFTSTAKFSLNLTCLFWIFGI